MVTYTILTLAAVCVGLLVLSMLFTPIQRSIGFANVSRRKWNSALVVAGSMVGTALIAGSLVMSDTSERALQNAAFAHLGEIDLTVRALKEVTFQIDPITPAMVETISLDALNEATDGKVDGVMTAVERDLPVVKVEADPNAPLGFRPVLAEPEVTVVGLDFASLQGFGSSDSSLAAQSTPVSGQTYVSLSLADELELAVGDDIAVYYQNQPSIYRVAQVLEDDGISGRRIDQDDSTGTVLLSLSDAQNLMGLESDRFNAILISNTGGVIEGDLATDSVQKETRDLLEEAYPDTVWSIRHDKQNALSEGGGPSTGDIFLMVSSFAILAGVMLIINIYAMLAEERRTEMGIMRAVAFSRTQLVMTFAYEGFVYSAIASVVGAIIGVALGALIVAGLSEMIAQDQSSSLEGLPLTIKPSTLLVSGAAGLLISFITAFVTSVRISRLNIVMAIRDLSEPESDGPGKWQLFALPLVFIIGAVLTIFGFTSANGYFQYIGPCVSLISGAAFVGRFLPPRLVFTLSGAAIIAYSFLADRLEEVKILIDEGPGLFFISGIFMLLAGMMIIAFNLSVVLWVVRLGSAGLKRLEPIVQIAIAYPAINRMRTAFTMGMFGLVLFGVTILTMYGGLLDGFINANLEKAAGGFDVVVYNTSSNRIEDLEAEIQASDEIDATQIASVMPVHRALVKFPDFERPKPDDPEEEPDEAEKEEDKYIEDSVHGIVSDFAAQQKYTIESRMDQFATDADAWAAVVANPNLALVSSRYDGTNERTDNAQIDPGDTVRLLNPATGDIVEKTVAGRLEPIEVGFSVLWGVIVSVDAFQQDFAESSFRGDAPRLFVMNLNDDTDLADFGKQLEKGLISTGAPVRVVREVLSDELQEVSTFLRIFQGFLAFGLIVGIAGLAVIAARSVYQRRQGIGMLRALGFQPGMVLASLLIEWSFIALVGILLGVGLGFLGGYRLYALFVREAGGAFTVPWFELIWITGLVYVASLIFTIIPALKASRMSPVEALRHQE
ncbi:MAG: FtsX-like permease family protein [SAR202 cluster bacterium]|nr:FtsX-like permease family protein [SAR202 cluster bacterium]